MNFLLKGLLRHKTLFALLFIGFVSVVLFRSEIKQIKKQFEQRYLYWGSQTELKWENQGDFRFRSATPEKHNGELAICFHGNGTDENMYSPVSPDLNATLIADSLLRDGYTILTAAYVPNTSTWGSQNGLDAYLSAYKWASSTNRFSRVVLIGISMGGLEALLTLAQKRIPNIRAVALNVPVCNLNVSYDTPLFRQTIKGAYQIQEDSEYSKKSKGHDPMLLPKQNFSVPILIVAATEDSSVPFHENTLAFAEKLGNNVRLVKHKGDHGISISDEMSVMMSFIRSTAQAPESK